MKKLYLLLICGLFSCSIRVGAQQDTTHALQSGLSFSGGLDWVSRFVWRGRDYEHSPAAQPWMEASWKGFTLGTWASYRLAGAGFQETDLYLSKDLGDLKLSVWDYYSFNDTLAGNYFDYHEATTGHLFELQAAWTSSWDDNTLNLLMGWFFAGYDKDRSYFIETSWTRTLSNNDNVGLVLGFTPKAGFYASRAAIVEVGVNFTKNLKLTNETSLPLGLSLVLNPEEKNLFLVAMLSL
ncbi:MAG: hypothetical protein ACP5O2_07135 [Bacteroidales bacterium]